MSVTIQNSKNNNTIFNTKDWFEYTEDVENALKKQLPKRPLKQRYMKEELIGVCPSCRLQWDVAFYQGYCSNCGQKLDWS